MKLYKTLKVHENYFLCKNLHKQLIQILRETTSLKERNKAIYIKQKGSRVESMVVVAAWYSTIRQEISGHYITVQKEISECYCSVQYEITEQYPQNCI